MKIARPISNHRRARLIAWARLWLVGLAACSAWWGAFERPIHERLDLITQMIVALVIVRVTRRWRWRAPHGRPAACVNRARVIGAVRRAFIGAQLRRALRARRIGTRITALLNVLRDLAQHTQTTLRRLKHGFTRRRPIHAARVDERVEHFAYVARAFSDSS